MDKVERARELLAASQDQSSAWAGAMIRRGEDLQISTMVALRAITAALEPLAERGREALLEALTPSADTKAAYIGEVKDRICVLDEDGEERWFDHTISWDATKEIMKLIRARVEAALREPSDV